MKKITSKDNPEIKKLKKLSQKKYRKEFSSFFVENFVIIKDSFSAGFKMEKIFLTEDFLKNNHREIELFKDKIGESNIDIIDEKINKSISSLDCPTGIVAEYKILKKQPVLEGPQIFLNGISDPGNLGTIFRTCLAFGFENVVCDKGCVDMYNSKTISAAKDSIFKLNIQEGVDFFSYFENLKDFPVFIAEASSGRDVSTASFPDKYILVFGSESHGVDAEILKIADEKINIKINKNLESLNVSSALAIFLYEISKRKNK